MPGTEMVNRQFLAISLKRNLVVRQRHRLHGEHRLRLYRLPATPTQEQCDTPNRDQRWHGAGYERGLKRITIESQMIRA